MSEYVVQTQQLVKKYRDFAAVDHLNLTVKRGEVYGFLGPNGAGKTTTLLMLMGIIKPTQGNARVFGESIGQDSFVIKQKIGMVTEYQKYYDDMTAWEYLHFFAQLFKYENFEARAEYLLEKLDLWNWKDVAIGKYSTGMSRKLGFARALLHSPELIILDEPVSGLDPKGILQVRTILKEEKDSGATILISSHILSEIEHTADRVGIMLKGRLIIEDDTSRLKKLGSTENRIEIEPVHPTSEILEKIGSIPFVEKVEVKDNVYIVLTPNDNDYRDVLGQKLLEMNIVIRGMRKLENSLEEAFVTITENEIQKWIED